MRLRRKGVVSGREGGKGGGAQYRQNKIAQGGYCSSRDKQVRVRVPLFFDLERFLSFCPFFFGYYGGTSDSTRCLIISYLDAVVGVEEDWYTNRGRGRILATVQFICGGTEGRPGERWVVVDEV